MEMSPKAPKRKAISTGAGESVLHADEERAHETSAASIDLEQQLQDGDMNTLHQLQVHQIELEMQNEELRQAQFLLDASRARYFDLYDLAPVGYCTVSEKGLIVEANLATATMLGADRSDLVRQRVSRFIVREDQDIFYLLRRQLLETGSAQSCELRMLKMDGSQVWAHLSATLDNHTESLPVMRLVMSDIDVRRKIEAELSQLDQTLRDKNVMLQQAINIADKANLAKSEFLSSMSHELRTPLSAILGFAQLVESSSPPPTPSQKSSIDQILKAGWYLLDLINEILDLALIESGRLILSIEPMSLSEVMTECDEMILPQLQKRSINVTFPALDKRHFVMADRTRVKQILLNLLSNAIKYNREGGTVVVACKIIRHDRIRISVEDAGNGLSEEKIAQLFQPFNRLGQESNNEAGTGIGLVVCKRLVELMGGIIGVESQVGRGSVFWIELNLATATATTIENKTCANDETWLVNFPTDLNAQSRTLLYVEDNPANLMLVEELMARRPDIRLLTARDASTGIAIAHSALPDVILMDINLPGISGITALKILLESINTSNIPIIALSANALPRDIENGLEAGFFRYLTKPIKVNELMNTIDLALKFANADSGQIIK